MKKQMLLLPFLLSASFLTAAEAIHSVSPTAYFNQQDQSKAKSTKQTTSEKAPTVAAVHGKSGQSEMMIINPEMRSKDIQESFDYLKKMSPAAKLAVQLTNGSMITEILDMKIMSGGTMIIFRVNSVQGQKFQVVKIEDIDTISHA